MNATSTAEGLAVRARRGKPFTPGNAAAHGRPPSLARLGVDLEKSSPAYQNAMRRAARYVQHRRREFSVAGGGHCSAGVAALLAASGRALAGSVLLSEQAGELLASTNPKIQKRAADLLVQSARLGAEARQGEVSALAVHAAETKARGEVRADDDMSWLLNGTTKTTTPKTTSQPADNSLNSPGFPVPPCASTARKERELSADSEAVDDVAEEPSA